jgi:ADP-heptose:LPS heptosyltransferase
MRPEFAHPFAMVTLGQVLEAAVTNDSGAAHMLAAGGTPLLTLFGYTNPVKYAPLTQRLITLSPSNGGKDIESISVETAAAALDRLLPSYR